MYIGTFFSILKCCLPFLDILKNLASINSPIFLCIMLYGTLNHFMFSYIFNWCASVFDSVFYCMHCHFTYSNGKSKLEIYEVLSEHNFTPLKIHSIFIFRILCFLVQYDYKDTLSRNTFVLYIENI